MLILKKLLYKVVDAVSKTLTLYVTSGTADFNDYKTEGKYYFSSGATLTNCPSGTNGWLIVLPASTGGVKQIWNRHGSYTAGSVGGTYRDTFIRIYGSGAWSEWERVVTESYLGTVSNVNTSAAVSLVNATDTDVMNSGSLSAGTYIIKAYAGFASNSTGMRRIFLSTSAGGSVVNRHARITTNAVDGDATRIQVTYLCTISSATTFYLRAYQDSGGSLNVNEAGFQILKIHA